MLSALNFLPLLVAFAITLLGLSACTDSKSVEFKTIYAGVNGSWKRYEQPGQNYNSPSGIYESESAVKASWLKKSISEDDLKKVLSKVDFSHQFLVVDMDFIEEPTVERPTKYFTVDFKFSDIRIRSFEDVISYKKTNEITSIAGTYLVETKCALGKPLINVFTIAVVERPKTGEIYDGGWTHYSAQGECKPFKSGVVNP
jgi:hypothetical protein